MKGVRDRTDFSRTTTDWYGRAVVTKLSVTSLRPPGLVETQMVPWFGSKTVSAVRESCQFGKQRSTRYLDSRLPRARSLFLGGFASAKLAELCFLVPKGDLSCWRFSVVHW